ncbi:MAG: hypothetical protein KatS3mg114_0530 [Planctomycetaceae bacterium]|nr:MAG: hypothetical protein KatS3mg114_0530 [Planctomycetaceae bacterium]
MAIVGFLDHEFLCGVHGAWQLRDWVTGGRCLSDVLTVGPDQITLCAGLQALTALQHYPSGVQQRLLSELEGLERTIRCAADRYRRAKLVLDRCG